MTPGHLQAIFDAVEASPLVAGVQFAVGPNALQLEGAPPRCVWVPGQDGYSSPRGYAGAGDNSPRSIWAIDGGVAAYLWAAKVRTDPGHVGELDTAATDEDHVSVMEALRQSVIQAIHQQMFQGYYYTLVGGSWGWGEGAPAVRFGVGYTLLISFALPVTMPASPEAQVNTMPISTEMDFPNGNVATDV